MKRIVVACTLVACGIVIAVPTAGAASTPSGARVAKAGCTSPPAAYRQGAKGSMWFSACLVCKNVGPKELARRANLSNATPSHVAHLYANHAAAAPQFRPLLPAVGGAAAAKAIMYAGCMAGFHARGRP